MSKKRSTTGTIASSLVVGLVIGAVGTLGYQAYQNAGEDVQQLTNDNETAYGIGGGDVLPEFEEKTGDVPSLDEQEDENAEEKKKESKDEEHDTEEEQENSVGGGVIEEDAGFSFPALTQPQIESISDESTVYTYGGDNAISVLSGETADLALANLESATEEEVKIDGEDARLVTTTSLKDGSTQQQIIVEREDDIILVRGDSLFLETVQSDLTF